MDNKKKCECCGFDTLPADSMFEVCPLCEWQDDPYQNEHPDYSGGANALSLNEYRETWMREHKRSRKGKDVA